MRRQAQARPSNDDTRPIGSRVSDDTHGPNEFGQNGQRGRLGSFPHVESWPGDEDEFRGRLPRVRRGDGSSGRYE